MWALLLVTTSLAWAAPLTLSELDPRISKQEDLVLLDGKPFQGVLKFPRGPLVTETSYRKGQKHGLEAIYTTDGSPRAERTYQRGQKVGRHRTWYADQKLRSETVFARPDEMRSYKEWYDNGVLAKQILFEQGKEVSTKIFRKTGQIYLNQVIRNGRAYGLPGGKACNRVEENGNVR